MEDVASLGRVSQGFNIGLEALWPSIIQIINNAPWVSCGHSRGAAQATLMAGYGIRAGKPPLFRIVFGEPLSCDGAAAKLIGAVPSLSFCNELNGSVDPIVTVPDYVPVIAPYVRVNPLIKLHAAPSANNPWLDYPDHGALHYMPDYERNVKNLYSQGRGAQ